MPRYLALLVLLMLTLPCAAQNGDPPPPITEREGTQAMLAAMRTHGMQPPAGSALRLEDYIVTWATKNGGRNVGLWIDANGNILPSDHAREAALGQCNVQRRYVASATKFLNFKLRRRPSMQVTRNAAGQRQGRVDYTTYAFVQYLNVADRHIDEQHESESVSPGRHAVDVALAQAWRQLTTPLGALVGVCGNKKPPVEVAMALHFSSRIEQRAPGGRLIVAAYEATVPLTQAHGDSWHGSAVLRNTALSNSVLTDSAVPCRLTPREGTLTVEATVPPRAFGTADGIQARLTFPPAAGGDSPVSRMPGAGIECPQAAGATGAAGGAMLAALTRVMNMVGAPWWIWYMTLHQSERKGAQTFAVTSGWQATGDPDVLARKTYRRSKAIEDSTIAEQTVLEIRRE